MRPKHLKKHASYTQKELSRDVAVKIFAARMKKGLTQAQLAKRINTLQPSIARAESGNILPGLDFLLKIANALDTGLIAPTFESLKNTNDLI